MKQLWITLLIGLVILHQSTAQTNMYFICATSRYDDQCQQLQRGNSMVNCIRVQDSVECAQRIRNGTAHFGLFSAESTLLLANLNWDGLSVIKEVRHVDRKEVNVDFSTVAIVRSTHANGLGGLAGLKFCHPGYFYDRTQRWSERMLKHFERTVSTTICDNANATAAEIETLSLAQYFGQSCRPGMWSNNVIEDRQLKEKYPELCALCNAQPGNCTYGDPNVSHLSNYYKAINCLVNGGGDVAYTSLEDVRKYFLTENPTMAGDYSFLCPNGSLAAISDTTPACTWLDQPWRTVIVNSPQAIPLKSLITGWMLEGYVPNTWQSALREIIGMDSYEMTDSTIQGPTDYFRPFREVPQALPLCSTTATWCTTSYEEKDKCEVIRSGGITTGVYPQIDCREPTTSTVSCLNDISEGRADFMGIDSNFGFLARHPHNLASAMYAETEYGKYSSIVVIVRANSTYSRFENLKNSKACFPEYGGIASIAFVNLGRNRGFIPNNDCSYGNMLSNFFDSSCLPGARDIHHYSNISTPENLCSLCKPAATQPGIIINVNAASVDGTLDGSDIPDVVDEVLTEVDDMLITRNSEVNCAADKTNRFYGNVGALQCLNEAGDVAVLELQYLLESASRLNMNEHDFRIMCRNGSLAENTGFTVDEDCALTTIVDGEIVVQRNSPKAAGIISAMNSFDTYFRTDPDFKMYNVFAGVQDLLFKDSTLGLVSDSETYGKHVSNYISLFEHLDSCVSGRNSATNITINFITLFAVFILLFRQLF